MRQNPPLHISHTTHTHTHKREWPKMPSIITIAIQVYHLQSWATRFEFPGPVQMSNQLDRLWRYNERKTRENEREVMEPRWIWRNARASYQLIYQLRQLRLPESWVVSPIWLESPQDVDHAIPSIELRPFVLNAVTVFQSDIFGTIWLVTRGIGSRKSGSTNNQSN